MLSILFNLLTVAALLFGLFFMAVGAIGLVRLPDFYGRMHAGSKCLTLGISGMLVAAVFHLADPTARPTAEVGAIEAAEAGRPEVGLGGEPVEVEGLHGADESHAYPAERGEGEAGRVVGAITKALLVIAFQFVAAPVGAHMLSRAAHADGVDKHRCVEDDLEADRPGFAAMTPAEAASPGPAPPPDAPPVSPRPATG